MVNSFLSYISNNFVGNKTLGTNNLLPASLTMLGSVLGMGGSQTQYDLYRQQALQYVDAARDNSQLIKQKGEVELRNLVYKNKIEKGNDVATLGAKGGRASGSDLDVLVQKEKVRKMNETTLTANYANQALMEMSNGYTNAISTYMTLGSKASADKWGAVSGILKGVEQYVASSVHDAKTMSTYNQQTRIIKAVDTLERDEIRRTYGIEKDQATDISASAPTTTPTTSLFDTDTINRYNNTINIR